MRKFIPLCLVIAFLALIYYQATNSPPKTINNPLPVIESYQPPQIPPSPSYTILFVGDSMTAALGENFDALRTYLKAHYPDKVFGLFNYAQPSSSVLSLSDLLTKPTIVGDKTLPPILDRSFDIIIIESFGHNPLSQFPLAQGLAKQSQILDQVTATLVAKKPNSLIIFLATIAPSKSKYALQSRDLSPQVRQQWVDERKSYIQNHIDYATTHHYPLIDVYHQSLDQTGEAILKYINKDDYIHPSAEGVNLISAQIADHLFTNQILQ